MNKRYCILDCYVDEPACFGVPPFMSPYPRYVYGALVDAGVNEDAIDYITIDDMRTAEYVFHEYYSIVFCIGGAIVPGKYLGFSIGTLDEIKKIITGNKQQNFAIGGMIAHLVAPFPNSILVTGDIEQFAFEKASGNNCYTNNYRTYDNLARWSVYGSGVVKAHPQFPNLIAEIETYRGCPRQQHCSFCAEGLFSFVDFRQEEDIVAEVDALIQQGITRFRIGRQADIISYKAQLNHVTNGFPRPQPQPIISLFHELQKRKESGKISMLNIDNANPGSIYYYKNEASTIIDVLAQSVTAGDTLALGVESFDPAVIKKNSLKLQKDQLLDVIQLINDIGGTCDNGIHRLLPGINLIHGLIGENADTFKINYESLLEILHKGLLVKRINIRSLVPFPGTIAAQKQKKEGRLLINRYRYYRQKIRHEIDHNMITKLYPVGTVIANMFVLSNFQGYAYAKEIRSYAITAKIPLELTLYNSLHCIVVGHQERSLLCLPYPVNINTLPQKALATIPGIGKKTASAIIVQRPFNDFTQAMPYLVSVPGKLIDAIKLCF